jgi:hypothetical protein
MERPVLLHLTDQIISSSLQNDQLGSLPTPLGSTNVDTPSPSVHSPFQKYRGSIAWTEGFEKNLHVLGKDQYPGRAMGVFTSGGDAQGSFEMIYSPSREPLLDVAFVLYAFCYSLFTMHVLPLSLPSPTAIPNQI